MDEKKILHLVELAKNTGKIKKGSNETTKAIEKREAKLVVIAKNVNPKEIVMHLPVLCQEKNIPFLEVSNKDDLGIAAGLNVGTSSVAIVKEGEGKKLMEEILSQKQND